ncbi:hypothetical protein [Paracoccus tegillarcae]|uniref:Uncharacterized protein n=1 Tax=Paracoccus tegillarcae TaxID=1529068 RepID=A0A2K9EI90_9RHOB|nr:hypothetical protein [Paracoccus tegillarcae]AUH34693.1 hypothetical protein CUV01_16045 [Paracoccus tegillarcae]
MLGPTANVIFAVLLTAAVGIWLRRHLHRRDWPIAAAFLVAVALTGFFGFRLVDRALYWTNPAHQHQAPQPWMTVGFLARSWHLPPPELAQAIGITDGSMRGLRLSEIAEVQGIPIEALIDTLNDRLAQERTRADGPDEPGATSPP